jgi:glycerol-3-phosphate dehydrogenase (NAD(P)+)
MGKVAVLGSGSWGIALANHYFSTGHEVSLWGRDKAVVDEVAGTGFSKKFFPEIQNLSAKITATTDLGAATSNAELIVFVIPSSAFRSVSKAASIKENQLLLSATKGLEKVSDLRMTEILSEIFPQNQSATLSGPSFAHEIIIQKPAALTIAANSIESAQKFQSYTHSSTMRIYTSEDLVGVELGGTIKNVIAIAAGVVDGAEIGVNARAALLTRGLSEMSRLILAAGGKLETVMGLSGMGDLILTATSDLSRNRRVGLALGKGGSLDGALHEIGQVSEGVNSAAQVMDLASKYKVQMPVCQEVLKLLEGKSSVKESVKALLSRAPVRE